ncbi:hypothetical protein ACJ73_09479 [Blastomyces percursus]|uniref:Uncharacterized protein n=1 Tax=Blastomyces percursus TaxID=1658174 RepID=A0A1J9PV51_9EURO|nr:hypothetical protein ACJ73_09479 [Blastomyces percursus]
MKDSNIKILDIRIPRTSATHHVSIINSNNSSISNNSTKAGETPKRTRAAAAKAQEKEASHPNTPKKQPGKPTMCEHFVSYIFPRHIESICDKVEGSLKPCSNCNREKKGCAICPDEFKADIENVIRTHKFYLSALITMKESIKPAMMETAKDLSKRIKKAKAR